MKDEQTNYIFRKPTEKEKKFKIPQNHSTLIIIIINVYSMHKVRSYNTIHASLFLIFENISKG